MSRIGKKPIQIPTGVTVTREAEGKLVVKGPKGELSFTVSPKLDLSLTETELTVSRKGEDREARSLHGMTRTMIQNMITGVTQGFKKTLEINGVGYRVQVQGAKLVLSLGYSHPIEYTAPKGIEFKLDEEKKNLLTISGFDKQLVGQVAAKLRALRSPEPYKGKGIKYDFEHIKRKAGKAAAAAGATGTK